MFCMYTIIISDIILTRSFSLAFLNQWVMGVTPFGVVWGSSWVMYGSEENIYSSTYISG